MEHQNREEMLQVFAAEQLKLRERLELHNTFVREEIRLIAGIDLAYWQQDGGDYAVCSIVVIDGASREVVEKKNLAGKIEVPYVAGYLSFRELPLILKTYELLEVKPDLVIFDGNGYLHYRNLGIASHASFYLKKPCIGVAKSYLKIDGVEFTMPADEDGAFTDIVIGGRVYGRALRTHKGVKPIFVSCGNWIDLDTSTEIVLELIDKESRQPIPTRYADLETKVYRREHAAEKGDGTA